MNKKKRIQKTQRIRKEHRRRRALGAIERSRRSGRWLPFVYEPPPAPKFQYLPNSENSSTIKIPSTFSFLEDPDGALKVLSDIREEVEKDPIRHHMIDHAKCSHLDLCASAIMDTELIRARESRRGTFNPLALSGKMSEMSFDVNVMLAAAGLPHRLKIKKYEVPPELASIFNTFEMQGSIDSKLPPSPSNS